MKKEYVDNSKRDVRLILVTSEEDKDLAKSIVESHHSYVPTYRSVGRRIDWLISVDNEIVGMIGIGSSTYPPCKDVLRYMGITKNEYKEKFNTIANNWRFCMAKNIPNIGTKILKLLREESKIQWLNKYGDKLEYLITFVGGGHNGAVYKADNWTIVGETSGLPSHKSVSMKWDNNEQLAQKFVKPDGVNKKIIFVKKV